MMTPMLAVVLVCLGIMIGAHLANFRAQGTIRQLEAEAALAKPIVDAAAPSAVADQRDR